MASFSVDAAYKKIDPQCLTVGTTEVAFPAPNTANVKNPEKIFVQALPGNTGNIVVSLTGVAADGSQGGFIIPPMGNVTLSCNNDGILKAIATAASQKLSIVYMADPN